MNLGFRILKKNGFMSFNRFVIYAGLLNAKNTGIGKYSQNMICALKEFNPTLIYVKRKSKILRLLEEFIILIKSIFLKTNDICIYSSERDLPFSILSKSRNKILVIHDIRFLKDKGIRNLLLRKILYLNKFKKIICVSKTISNELKDFGFISEVLYNPIEIENREYITSIRYDELNLNDLKFSTLGSFEKRKNIDFLIELAEFFPNYIFNIFISKFYFEKSNKKFTAKLRNFKNIKLFIGLKDDQLFQKMKYSKIFLCFSNYEGFGRTYIEAQKIGIPVLALENNITSEVLSESAYLMKDLSIKSFQAGVKDILNKYKVYEQKSILNSNRFSYIEFKKILNEMILGLL